MNRHQSYAGGHTDWPLRRGTRIGLASLTRSLSALTTRVLAGWPRRDARRAIHELRMLDDHTLRDIGIHRSEISSIVMELSGEERSQRIRR